MGKRIETVDGDVGRATAGRTRPGGRSERVVRDVLCATIAELADVGYAALRMEDVAARAAVNKTTVYRRWPTKVELVGAAMRSMPSLDSDLPDTGSVRGDLVELVKRSLRKAKTAEGQCVIRMLVLEADQPEVAALALALRAAHHAPWIQVVERAIAGGELPKSTEPRIVVETLLSALLSRRLFFHADSRNEAYLVSVVNLVVKGAEHDGARLPRATARAPRRRGHASSKKLISSRIMRS